MALKTDPETLTKELKAAAKLGRNFVFSPGKKPGESQLLSLVINIAIPAIILMKFSGENHLGPVAGLLAGQVQQLVNELKKARRRYAIRSGCTTG